MAANQEMKVANLNNLMFAQQLIRNDFISAKHLLGVNDSQAEFIANLSPSQLSRLSDVGTLLFSFRFSDDSLDRLTKFVEGDPLSFTHTFISQISRSVDLETAGLPS